MVGIERRTWMLGTLVAVFLLSGGAASVTGFEVALNAAPAEEVFLAPRAAGFDNAPTKVCAGGVRLGANCGHADVKVAYAVRDATGSGTEYFFVRFYAYAAASNWAQDGSAPVSFEVIAVGGYSSFSSACDEASTALSWQAVGVDVATPMIHCFGEAVFPSCGIQIQARVTASFPGGATGPGEVSASESVFACSHFRDARFVSERSYEIGQPGNPISSGVFGCAPNGGPSSASDETFDVGGAAWSPGVTGGCFYPEEERQWLKVEVIDDAFGSNMFGVFCTDVNQNGVCGEGPPLGNELRYSFCGSLTLEAPSDPGYWTGDLRVFVAPKFSVTNPVDGAFSFLNCAQQTGNPVGGTTGAIFLTVSEEPL